MDSQRNILLGAFLLVCFLIWQAWQQDNAPHPAVQSQVVSSTAHQINGALGGTSQNNIIGQQIQVKTDVLDVTINTQGGTLESAALLKYNATLGSTTPLMLLKTSPNFVYQAQSALIPQGQSASQIFLPPSKQVTFASQQSNYAMQAGQNTLEVPLTYTTSSGVKITKIFIFKRGQYDVQVKYEVSNPTSTTLNLAMVGQLRQSNDIPKNATTKTSSGFGMHEYRGSAYSSQSDKYKKYSFDDIKDNNLNISTQGGWVAMLQQYFATAWVPPANTQNQFYTKSLPQLNQSIIGFETAPISIAPNSNGSISSQLWVGPELQDAMAKVAPHLDLSVDYGWLWFISQPLFKLLQFIQKFVHNWGVAIIIITFIVRGIMYPLTRAQYTSMAKMKLLQPRIQAMKERLGDDKQRASQEMMALYRKEKVNPLGGCLPLVIQMPIFLALYYMLGSSVELRQAPFALWIHDLSAPDPYYILPLIMGVTMFLIQKMSPTPVADPMQQKIMTFMPVIFTVFFLWFPSGLVLYYIVSNLVTITQQKIIYRGLEKRGLHTRTKKKK